MTRSRDQPYRNAGSGPHVSRLRYRWQKATAYITTPIALLIVGRIWFAGFQSIATFLGLVSAGIAIALKDILVNLAGWVFIIWRRPFALGDRIQIGQHAGDVIDVRLFQFTLNEIGNWVQARSEEHTSELQSRGHLVCRLLLEKK